MAVTAHNITKIVDLKCSFYKVKKLNLKILNVRFQLRSQPVDATHALNLLAGVSNPNVLRGRSFN